MPQGFAPKTMALTLPSTMTANMPPATDYPGSVVYCPDAAGGASLMLSDGSFWRPFARGQQGKRVVTLAGGIATWTFATPYPAGTIPIANYMVENATGQPMSVDITAISNTSVSIRLKQARTLPSTITLLSSLLNFDIFGGTGIAGVAVHMTVRQPTE